MNSRLMQYAIVIVVVTCTISVLKHRQAAPTISAQSRVLGNEQTQSTVFDWQSVLLSMSQYQKPKLPSIEEQTADTSIISIRDSRLVAIVTEAPKTAAVILPERNPSEPINYREGEGWLDNWIIARIEDDAVVWQHIETQETYKQYLFE